MSAKVERRLLHAAMAVLAKHGMSGLTVDKIADTAGVPRTTFYRRWRSANEAVAAAIEHALSVANPQAPATGSFREDLTILGTNMARLLNKRQFALVLSFVIAEMECSPDFRTSAMDIVRHRRQYPAEVLQRAQKAKQAPLSLDVELLVEMFVGAMFFRLFFGETPPDDAYVNKLVDRIIAGGGVARDQSKSRRRRRK
jgi:AcrR family transcriptional regulator